MADERIRINQIQPVNIFCRFNIRSSCSKEVLSVIYNSSIVAIHCATSPIYLDKGNVEIALHRVNVLNHCVAVLVGHQLQMVLACGRQSF